MSKNAKRPVQFIGPVGGAITKYLVELGEQKLQEDMKKRGKNQ